MLSLHIYHGLGRCSPQDLCEIWAAQPDSDRRLQGLQWYEKDDDSGIEYLVLHVVGTSDFSRMEDWWVRLERDGREFNFSSIHCSKLIADERMMYSDRPGLHIL